MTLSFDKPVRAVVTGAGGGLGRALCLELARRNARIVAADIDLAGAQETASMVEKLGSRVHALACDVAQRSAVAELASSAASLLGGVDLLINNAGVATSGPVDAIPQADWEWIMGVNLWGVIYGCEQFVPHMRAQGGGHVINVASSAGLLCTPMMAPYNVTKAGVVALSETMAAELAPANIGVTVLCPTFFRTRIIDAGRHHGENGASRAASKLMDRAKMQAPEVARFALDAAAAGTLYALPHADGSWLWRLKRLAPERFYQKLVPRYFSRFARR
ncbi:SDR family NAD(P)-dependent oxidoreductase [Nannocystis bainbridge]|uniref:SDR family NAD(P)-dependent oxidoreductase n=1 Tax=Nannocystis bainbridge TaxID=2995303 RepID=A0ABT5DT24_9BACT|nr:SDR family NAD(P)-dependent oxidoreductase [Nannocystis bainbridge]MDC0715562.1 SDR family NAD(P)-dependent oxidoreductase [Nannocystis bainbridge]